MNKIPRLIIKFFCLYIFSAAVFAQNLQTKDASEIFLNIQKFNVLGSVLYIGAHPDDENTGLISFFAKGKKYRTAYLSLTRGDGGQNLIGKEKGDEIGIIRTQELLQARSIDGGEQYFTRAVDFGYSKTAEETFKFWGKENILSDVVWVIREYKPDVVITRFPPDGNGGHGHHTASAILAKEAFDAAANPKRFPEQLKYVQPWQAKRLFWNSWRPGQDAIAGLISVDIGTFNPLLGKSYSEIAALSRSMHKSQGFGSSASRGTRMEYFQQILGDSVSSDIFQNINTTWNRITNGKRISTLIEDVLNTFNPLDPSSSVSKLTNIYKELDKFENNYWIDVKKKELLNIIQDCLGLWIEATSDNYSSSPGEFVNIKTSVITRTNLPIELQRIQFATLNSDTLIDKHLEPNAIVSVESKILLPDGYPISQPYWLKENHTENLFTVSDQKQIGLAENGTAIPVKIYFKINGEVLEFTVPVFYKWNDRVEGEQNRPFQIRPPVICDIDDRISIFTPETNQKEITIKLKSNINNAKGELHLHTNNGWNVFPDFIPISIDNKYGEQQINFKVTAPLNAGSAELKLEVNLAGKTYNYSQVEISYPHIRRQIYFPESKIKLINLDIKKSADNIGYIEGSGDDIPQCLNNLGYNVSMLSDKELENSNLSNYDAIISGIRTYNTRERSKYFQQKLMDYIYNGGTYIVQYNVNNGLLLNNLGPYPFSVSNDRITDEISPVNFINTDHPLLNFPNKITPEDFNGWVQERGLYFASDWDSRYETVFSGNDPNEKELKGGLLYAKYGKGIFIFSAYSWFRQLPAGVPGAYKIFVNLISAGKYNDKLTN